MKKVARVLRTERSQPFKDIFDMQPNYSVQHFFIPRLREFAFASRGEFRQPVYDSRICRTLNCITNITRLLTVPIGAAAAPLDGVVDVVVVAECEGALDEEEDGERVEGGDERDGERVPAALTAATDPVAAHDDDWRRGGGGIGPRAVGHVRVGRHLGLQSADCKRKGGDATTRRKWEVTLLAVQ